MVRIKKTIGVAMFMVFAAAHAGIELPWRSPHPAEAPRAGGAGESLPEADERGLLELKWGDRITVQLEAWSPETGVLTARHPLMRGPIAIEAAGLLRYSAPSKPFDAAVFPAGFLVLNNGDRFRASNLAMEASVLRFQSPYLGTISVARDALREWSVHSGLTLCYAGPVRGEEWRSSKRPLHVESSALLLEKNERVSLTLPMWPRRSRVDFMLLGTPQHEVSAFFYAQEDVPGEITGSAYRFSLRGAFHNQQAVLSRRMPDGEWSDIGAVETPFGNNWSEYTLGARITLYFDLTGNPRIIFRIKGLTVAEWRDPKPFSPSGRTLAFSVAAPTTIAQIAVYEWDGEARSMLERLMPIATDEIQTTAGDRLSGDILAIASNEVRMRTQLGEIRIPFDQTQICRFRSPLSPSETPSMEGYRIWLLDGSVFQLEDFTIREGAVSGRHAWAGPIQIPLRAAKMVQWPRERTEPPVEEAARPTRRMPDER